MKYLILIGLIALMSGCGMEFEGLEPLKEANIEIEAPEEIRVETGLDYRDIADFCDSRYGNYTEESEKCISKLFSQLDIGINLDSIIEYCEETYTTEEDVLACEEDFRALVEKGADVGGE